MGVAEVAVGMLFAWAVRAFRRSRGQAGDEDEQPALEAALGDLEQVVRAALDGNDELLDRLRQEAAEGRTEPTTVTQEELTRALDEAAGRDAHLERELRDSVNAAGANSFYGPTAAQFGDHNTQHNHFGS